MHRPPTLRRLTITALGIIVGALVPLGSVAAQSADDPAQSASDLSLPATAEIAAHANLPVEDAPPTPPDVLDLDVMLEEVEGSLEMMPAEEWVLADVAAALGGEPEAAFAFVRDRIAFDPYAGVLRSPQGTLAARAGNSWDRALLLRALLDPSMDTRLAVGSLDDTDVLIERALAGPAQPLDRPEVTTVMPFDVEAMAARARRDHALLLGALGDRHQLLGSATGTSAAADPIAADHAWLQVSDGAGAWLDLDPTLLDSEPGEALVTADRTHDEVPDEARHQLTLRLVAESVTPDGLATEVLLDETLPASLAADRDMWLLFGPENPGVGGALSGALGETAGWVPALFMHDDVRTGEPFAFGAGAGKGGESVLGDTLGGLGGLGGGATSEETDPLGLTELRLELETTGPGLEPQSSSRILHAGGSGEAQPDVLRDAHHILVSNGGFDLRRLAVARGAVTIMAAEILNQPEIATEYRLIDQLLPWAVADRTLAAVSEHAIAPGLTASGQVRAYVGRPRAWIVSHRLDADDESFGGTVDLAVDGISLVGTPDADATELAGHRLWYGVLQTALETEIARKRIRRAGDGPILSSVSIDTGSGLSLLEGPGDAPDSSALAQALAAGSLVLGADYPATGSFWTVDPISGATSSVQEPGVRPSTYGGSYPGGGGGYYRVGPGYTSTRLNAPSRTTTTGGGLEYQIVQMAGYAAAIIGSFGVGWLIGRAIVNVLDWMYSD